MKVNEDGDKEEQIVYLEGFGEGITMGFFETDQEVFVSGKGFTLKDTEGKPLKLTAADILLHELIGHAIPMTVGTDTGNAIDNENKARKQLNKGKGKLVKSDPDHIEGTKKKD